MLLALTQLIFAADPAPLPPSPACLTGRLVGKDAELGDAQAELILTVALKNGCEGTVRGYRGRILLVGPTPGISWNADVLSYRPVLQPGEEGEARWTIKVGASAGEMWAAATPYKKMKSKWTTQIAIFEDGTAAWLPDVAGDAVGNEAALRRIADAINQANAVPVYVVP